MDSARDGAEKARQHCQKVSETMPAPVAIRTEGHSMHIVATKVRSVHNHEQSTDGAIAVHGTASPPQRATSLMIHMGERVRIELFKLNDGRWSGFVGIAIQRQVQDQGLAHEHCL